MSSNFPLSNNQLLKIAPSIFASSPVNNVTNRYLFIPTSEVIDIFRDNGWYPVYAKESFARDINNQGYQTHIIRFRHITDLLKKDEEAIEILLRNSHNRRSAFEIKLGVFRFVCENRLVVADSMFKSFSIRHITFNASKVESAINEIVAYLPTLKNRITDYKSINLSDDEKYAYASAAKDIRFSNDYFINAYDLLKPRRKEDEKDDLWSVFNRVEENCIRGGIKGKNIYSNRNFTSKPITSIDKQLEINEKLFELTDKFAQIKLSA